jgi:hypothetical protein
MLPARRDDRAALPRFRGRAGRQQQRTELAIVEHRLNAWHRAAIDQIDSQSTADAIKAALHEELDLLDYGLRSAGGSAAKAVLVSRKVEQFSALNGRRIGRAPRNLRTGRGGVCR